MSTQPIRVFLVDDHKTILDPLASRINNELDLEIAGTASDGETGLRTILETKPDVVVLDIDIPGRGSFDIASEMISRLDKVKVIFLSGFLRDVYIDQSIKIKAHGYVLKWEPLDFLLNGIRQVFRGEYCYSKEVLERLDYDPEKNSYHIKSESRILSLTARQLEVLRYLAHGQSVKEVASAMHLSEKSVDSHKYRIMHKLDIHDRVELARFAIREGLIMP